MVSGIPSHKILKMELLNGLSGKVAFFFCLFVPLLRGTSSIVSDTGPIVLRSLFIIITATLYVAVDHRIRQDRMQVPIKAYGKVLD